MCPVSYSKVVTFPSILYFLYILQCPEASDISSYVFWKSLWFICMQETCYTEKVTAFIMSGCLTEVWPDPWAVKCPCIYFSSLNIRCLWRSPGPQTCCCHLVHLCWRGSVPCYHPLQGKGSLRGAPGTRDTLLGVGPSELAMRSSLKICLQTPWKQERGCSVTSPGPRRVDTGVFAKCGPANTLRKTQEAGFATSCSKCRRG